jgi:hypothetical protein
VNGGTLIIINGGKVSHINEVSNTEMAADFRAVMDARVLPPHQGIVNGNGGGLCKFHCLFGVVVILVFGRF